MTRPIRISVVPTALDRNGISLSETIAATGLEFEIGGTLAADVFDANSIATTQTPLAAGNLTLAGVLATGDGVARRLCVFGGSNESARTFTVTGTIQSGNRPLLVQEVITGPNADTVFGSTAFLHISTIAVDDGTAGAITVGTQGSVVLTTPQHVTIFSAADDTGVVFTVTGTDRNGVALTEDITGLSAGTALGVKNFASITQVVADGLTAGGAEVGVDGLAESQWLPLNYRGPDFNVGLGADISTGAVLTYTVQHTFDDVLVAGFAENDAVTFNHDTMTAQTGNSDGNYINPPVATRMAITVHTSGSVNYNVIQAGRA